MNDLTIIQYGLGGVSGILIGLTLGLFGGGGSILAVPLLVYFVGVPSAHMAIGTSALAVAANALAGLANHARHGSIRWAAAFVFSTFGIIGAWVGSSLGKAFNGDRLLFLFALLMMGVAVMMFLKRDPADKASEKRSAGRVAIAAAGGTTGLLSGFFGIGGGFLIVPALMWTTGMPILDAVGTSLFAVTTFGLTTASNYAFSGLVDWPLTAALVVGGAVGSILGERGARVLSKREGWLSIAFSVLVTMVGIYMAVESWHAFS